MPSTQIPESNLEIVRLLLDAGAANLKCWDNYADGIQETSDEIAERKGNHEICAYIRQFPILQEKRKESIMSFFRKNLKWDDGISLVICEYTLWTDKYYVKSYSQS